MLNRLVISLALLGVFSSGASGQAVTGQEVPVTYSGTVAQLASPNTPATNFAINGTNTFLLAIPTNSAIRVYVTNNTANACSNAFTLQFWAASDGQVASFNNSLSNWQVIPLQNTDGTLLTVVSLTIPVSGSTYITSTAISSPRVAIQLVNTGGGCASTNVEVVAVITPINVTSPLISAQTGVFSGNNGQVQGVVAPLANGALVNPIIPGGLTNPINGNFLPEGLDNFGGNSVLAGPASYSRGTVPRPSTSGEFALAFTGNAVDSSSAFIGLNSGWGCIPAPPPTGGCSNSAAGSIMLTYSNVLPNTTLQQTATAPLAINVPTIFAVFKNTPVIGAHNVTGSNAGTGLAVGSTNAGSVMVVGIICNQNTGQTLPNCVTNIASALGLTYVQLTTVQGDPTKATPAASLWIATSLSPGGSETVTPTLNTLTLTVQVYGLELRGLSAASLNQPTIPNQADTIGNEIIRLDAQAPNQWRCTTTLTTNATQTCLSAPATVNGVPVRAYVTDMQINTTTAATGASTISFSAAVACASGPVAISAINYPNIAIGITSQSGYRTPLVAPLQQAVCATQGGGVAGTSVVELRGFFAP